MSLAIIQIYSSIWQKVSSIVTPPSSGPTSMWCERHRGGRACTQWHGCLLTLNDHIVDLTKGPACLKPAFLNSTTLRSPSYMPERSPTRIHFCSERGGNPLWLQPTHLGYAFTFFAHRSWATLTLKLQRVWSTDKRFCLAAFVSSGTTLSQCDPRILQGTRY